MITITKVGSLVKIDGIEGKDNVYESISNFQGARISDDGTQLKLQIGEVSIDYKPFANFTIGGVVPTNAATVQSALATVFPNAAPGTALPTETVATYSAMTASIASDSTTKRDFFVSADETNGGGKSSYRYDGAAQNELAYKAESKSPFQALRGDLSEGVSTSIVLLGDSTANADDEWLYLFIQDLMAYYAQHSVKYLVWNDVSQIYDAPRYLRGNDSRYYNISTMSVYLPSSYISMPTGDMDIRMKINAANYANGGEQNLIAKFGNTPQRSFRLYLVSASQLSFAWTEDGSTQKSVTSTTGASAASLPVSNGTDIWVRVTWDVDNGASAHAITFYYSTDGITWVQLGDVKTSAGVTPISATTSNWELGARGNTTGLFTGKIYHLEIRNGINGAEIISPSVVNFIQQDNTTSKGGNPVFTIWNGSHPGASITYLADPTRLKAMCPIDDHSCVMFSCNHNDSNRQGSSYLAEWDGYLTSIRGRIKTGEFVLMTQNPRISPAIYIDLQAKRRGQLIGWTKKNGLGVVDTYAAFVKAGVNSTYINSADGTHPTAAGSRLWADTVKKAFNS
jgi:hypothetical protein